MEIVFLISCFVICMSAWGRTVGEFTVSRLSRLFPAYWVGIVLTALVVKRWPEITSQHGWGTVITNLTMLQGGNNNTPLIASKRGNIARDRRLAKPAIPRIINSPPPLLDHTWKGTTETAINATCSSPSGLYAAAACL
ncbi:hypothetical protein ACFVJH_34105 [Streptomyces decoyicus]|uniref:hypothetical protein n=1 Tax=Streptomyces decoyicus TaxID=249567 RepID=UPI003635EF89